MKLDISIRLGTMDDLSFIYNSWIQQTKHQYPNQFALDFVKHYQQYLQDLIPKSNTLVAYLEGDSNEIISFLVYTSFRGFLIVHYAYTKLDARNQGILNQLLQFANPLKQPIVFTHAAKNENMMDHLANKYIFDPSIMKELS